MATQWDQVMSDEPSSIDERRCAVFVAIRGFALAKSRLHIMKKLQQAGWRVIAAGNADEHVDRLTNAGIEFEEVKVHRGHLSPLRELATYHRLKQLYRKYQPDLIHHFQAKPVIIGCAAARVSPRSVVLNTITGLGHAFVAGGFTKWLATAGYRAVLGRATKTIFQNPDDRQVFRELGLVEEVATALIISSGVNLDQFQPAPIDDTQTPRVLMVARLLWEKGVGEFVEAARRCRQTMPHVRFELAGEFADGHPNAVPRSQVESWVDEGVIDYLGYVRDVPQLLSRSTVVVLPSYREGVPRVLLEAAACGRPVITADAPGCREAVEDQSTGYLVPVKDAASLAAATQKLVSNLELCQQMGVAGRCRVETQFDEQIIANRYLDLYRQVGLAACCQEQEVPRDAKVA